MSRFYHSALQISHFQEKGDKIATSENGLWQPLTDGRILAVMPMALSGTWLYGERGLASADRPVLVISPTED